MRLRPHNLSIFVVFIGLTLLNSLYGNSLYVQAQGGPKPCSVKIPLPETLAPLPGEFRFAAVGDTGTGNRRQLDLAATMFRFWETTARFNTLLFLGDNVYPSGNPAEFEKKLYTPYRKFRDNNLAIRGVIGNHDARNPAGIREQMRYFRGCGNACGPETYYSFSGTPQPENLVEFFALDSNLLITKDGKSYTAKTREMQIRWLEEALARSKAVWKIVLLHHPLYSSAKGHGVKMIGADGSVGKISEKVKNLREIEPLFLKYNVKLVLAGHDHLYERILPRPGQVYYFTSGAGAKLRRGDLNRRRLPEYHGCGVANHLSFMFFSAESARMRYWSIGEDGRPFDSGEIN